MTVDQLRAAADGLLALHRRFAPLFGYRQAQGHAAVFLRGLLLAQGRKSVEPIALTFGDGQVHALQKFMTLSPWEYHPVEAEIQTVFAEEFVPSTAQWSLGTVGILDESAFVKKGDCSVGVKRQWCGRLGKKENCQVGVFLVGLTPAGSALLEHQLYLPDEWASDPRRRQECRVPGELRFATKPQIALALLDRVRAAARVHFNWLTFDEGYGRDGAFLSQLEAVGQHYVAEVPVNTSVWPADVREPDRPDAEVGPPPRQAQRRQCRSVQAIAKALPASAWQNLQLREGTAGPLVSAFAWVRVWARRGKKPGRLLWLLVRRSLGQRPEYKYYLCHAAADTSPQTLALVSSCRNRVEEFFEECKGQLGMADYEGRSWTSWHHHMTMVALAHLLVSQTRMRLKKNAGVDIGDSGAGAASGVAASRIGCQTGDDDHSVSPKAEPHGQAVAP